MLDVVVLCHGICRGGDAVCRKFSLRAVFECNNIRYTRSQLVRAAYSGDASEVVHIGLVVEVVQVAAFLGDAVAVIEIACLASVAERIFYTFHIHVHFRLVAVLVPHALSLGIGRKCLLQDVAEAVITVVGDGFAVSELLRYLGQVVGVLRVIYRRYLVVNLSVSSGHGHIGRQSEDVPAAVGGIADGGLVIKLAVSLAAELALVAEPVGFQFTVVAGEVILVPCLRGNHSLCGTFVLQVRRIAERYEGGSTVTAQYGLCGKGVLVTLGGQVVAVIFVACFGVNLSGCIFHGSVDQVALRIVAGHVILLYRLAVERIFLFGVEIPGNHFAETEELTFVAVALAVLVFKGGGHERTVVMDAVIHREGRHHPFAAGKPVCGSGMSIVQRKRTAERVGDCLQHVRPADGGTGHFQLAFLLRFHNVEIAVTVHVLQGIRGAADAVTGGKSRIC